MLRSIKFRDLPEFLATMYAEIQEEKLWEIYLSNPLREQSFDEWKKAAVGDGRTKQEIETEAIEAAGKALSLLNNLGGDVNGI